MKMKHLIILLLLSGCVNRPVSYEFYKKTIAEQQMDRFNNTERGLINEAKEYQRQEVGNMDKIIKKFKEVFLTLNKAENCVGITYIQDYKKTPYRIAITKLKNRRTEEKD